MIFLTLAILRMQIATRIGLVEVHFLATMRRAHELYFDGLLQFGLALLLAGFEAWVFLDFPLLGIGPRLLVISFSLWCLLSSLNWLWYSDIGSPGGILVHLDEVLLGYLYLGLFKSVDLSYNPLLFLDGKAFELRPQMPVALEYVVDVVQLNWLKIASWERSALETVIWLSITENLRDANHVILRKPRDRPGGSIHALRYPAALSLDLVLIMQQFANGRQAWLPQRRLRCLNCQITHSIAVFVIFPIIHGFLQLCIFLLLFYVEIAGFVLDFKLSFKNNEEELVSFSLLEHVLAFVVECLFGTQQNLPDLMDWEILKIRQRIQHYDLVFVFILFYSFNYFFVVAPFEHGEADSLANTDGSRLMQYFAAIKVQML